MHLSFMNWLPVRGTISNEEWTLTLFPYSFLNRSFVKFWLIFCRFSEKLQKVITNAEKEGYTVKVQLITADVPELLMRNVTRTFTSNRLIDGRKLITDDVVKGIENNYNALNEKYKIGKIDNSKRNFSGTGIKDGEQGTGMVYENSGLELGVRGYSEDIVAKFSPDDKIPDQTIINKETGELENTYLTKQEVLQNEQQDQIFLDRLKDCI